MAAEVTYLAKTTTFAFDCDTEPAPDAPVSSALAALVERLREMLSDDGGDHVVSLRWADGVMSVELERD